MSNSPTANFPHNLIQEVVTFRIIGNVTIEVVGKLLAIETLDFRKWLKIEQGSKTVYINFDHVAALEKKDQ